MAALIEGILVRDVRLDAEGQESAGGRLFLRGTTAKVHRDIADSLLAQPKRVKKPKAQDKQAIPPETKEA